MREVLLGGQGVRSGRLGLDQLNKGRGLVFVGEKEGTQERERRRDKGMRSKGGKGREVREEGRRPGTGSEDTRGKFQKRRKEGRGIGKVA